VKFRHLAPAGAPIGMSDLWRWASALSRDAAGSNSLAGAIRVRFGADAFLTSTGRAGLSVLLGAMRRTSQREADEVIVPSYTCYSVPASVVRAGLRPRVVDVDPATLDYDLDKLAAADHRRVLAVVATNLYGNPSNLPAIVALAREREVLVVDDAAQAMGASIDDQPSGTFGDAGLFSFDKGKNVSAIDGGVLLTRSPLLASALAADVARLPLPPIARRTEHVAKALVYAGLLHPRLYWIPNSIPQLGLGGTAYTTEYPIEAMDPTLAALGVVMLKRLDAFAAHRRRIAGAYAEALRGMAGISLVPARPGHVTAALRFPVLIDDASQRQALLDRLNAKGIGATGSYPSALPDVPALQAEWAGSTDDTAGGRHIAARIVTLPTHPHVTLADVAVVAEILRRRAVIGSTVSAGSPSGG
jgi:perosamine synthetase